MEENKNINMNTNFGIKLENLPNARAGHPYRTLISGEYYPFNPLAVCWFDGLEKTGLHFFPDKKQITGVPRNSGSFDVQFNIRKYNEDGMEEVSTQTLKLVVEEDYNIKLEEVDENDPYWKLDEEVRTVPVNTDSKKKLKKDIAAASRRGYHQFSEGKIREDDFYIHYDPKTRWYALAVADGSGKSEYSRKGSKIACHSAVESCLRQLTKQARGLKKLTIRYTWRKSNRIRREILKRLHSIIASSVTKAYNDIVAEATEWKRLPDDYATTLLMCICKKFEFGWLVGTFGAGDGAVCVYRKDKWYANLMRGDECASEKCYLTTPGIILPPALNRRIRFTIVNDFSALFLMTNGVSDPKFESEADLPCFELWDRFWEDLSTQVNFSDKLNDTGENLLKWLDFWTAGKNDDRTIAMVF